MTEATCIKN